MAMTEQQLTPFERADLRRANREQEARERAALLAPMTEAERVLRFAIWRDLCGDALITPGELRRRIFVTPVAGAYGDAGAVLCIEGSPPHGAYAVMGQAVRWNEAGELAGLQVAEIEATITRAIAAW